MACDATTHALPDLEAAARGLRQGLAPANPHRAGDHLFHDLVRAAVDALHARVGVRASDRVLPHEAVAAVQLQALVHHLALQVGGPVLGHARRRGVELACANELEAFVDEDAADL